MNQELGFQSCLQCTSLSGLGMVLTIAVNEREGHLPYLSPRRLSVAKTAAEDQLLDLVAMAPLPALGQGQARHPRPPRRLHRLDLSLPLNPSRCSEDWLRPFVLGSEGHPAWTNVFRCGVSNARRRKTEKNRTDWPTGDFSVAGTPRSRKDLTPPGVCSDDGGRRPWASRSCLGRGAPSVSAPGSPSPVRGGSGHGGSRQGSLAAGDAGGSR